MAKWDIHMAWEEGSKWIPLLAVDTKGTKEVVEGMAVDSLATSHTRAITTKSTIKSTRPRCADTLNSMDLAPSESSAPSPTARRNSET